MSQATKRTHKVIDASKKQPVKRLNQKDLDTSCFRLSRVAQKYKSNRAVKQEEQRSFIDRFYSENPDALDIRSPDEKLEEIQNQLQDENLEPHDRFLLIAQQKQLNTLKYGEESAEVMQSEEQLGIYYNEIGRPKSAIRHLTKAHQLEKNNKPPPEESVVIAVESVDAYLTIHDSLKKNEAIRNMNKANELLKPVADVQLEDAHLTFRRDISIARVSSLRGKFTDAMEQYETALKSLEADVGKDTAESANILCEMGQNAEYADEKEKSRDYYFSAFQIYRALDMNAEAESILPKFKTEEEEEEEEKPNEDDGFKAGEEEEEGVLEQTINSVLNKTVPDNTAPEEETVPENTVTEDQKNDEVEAKNGAKLGDVIKDAITNPGDQKEEEEEKANENNETDKEISDDFLDSTMKSSQKEEDVKSGNDENKANNEIDNTDAKNDGEGRAEQIISGIGGNLIG